MIVGIITTLASVALAALALVGVVVGGTSPLPDALLLAWVFVALGGAISGLIIMKINS
tara:strand:- start:1095 stop:1268 length:174 start_codon:yes stop_codon:yes gene_type:complete